jgi:hypothetical protein
VSQKKNQPDYPVADGLASVCERLETIRRDLHRRNPEEQRQDPDPVLGITEAIREGSDLADPLQGLHTALLKAGDPTGVWGHVQPSTREVTLVGDDPGMAFEVVYRCPLGRCSGRTPDNTTTFPMICALSGGSELIKKTLPG